MTRSRSFSRAFLLALPLLAFAAPAAAQGASKIDAADTAWMIAATALVHGAQVWTQDSDFTGFAAVDVVRV